MAGTTSQVNPVLCRLYKTTRRLHWSVCRKTDWSDINFVSPTVSCSSFCFEHGLCCCLSYKHHVTWLLLCSPVLRNNAKTGGRRRCGSHHNQSAGFLFCNQAIRDCCPSKGFQQHASTSAGQTAPNHGAADPAGCVQTRLWRDSRFLPSAWRQVSRGRRGSVPSAGAWQIST